VTAQVLKQSYIADQLLLTVLAPITLSLIMETNLMALRRQTLDYPTTISGQKIVKVASGLDKEC